MHTQTSVPMKPIPTHHKHFLVSCLAPMIEACRTPGVLGSHTLLGLTRSEGVLYTPKQICINSLCPRDNADWDSLKR
ncbi:unnamed protein product [Periconia digitata]|uniref:Uncharacterized protein n=1 Tax=Periconia digitata TaxID=1303443 RepID=A0A9W4UP54_9PLEO|nr:unnamed protein product [Periconia digitata]